MSTALHKPGLIALSARSISLHPADSAPKPLQRKAFPVGGYEKKQKQVRANPTMRTCAAVCTPSTAQSAIAPEIIEQYCPGVHRMPERAAANVTPKEPDAAFLHAQLHLLVNAASDRAEMHTILAQQRNNWNKLFQNTLTSASLTACILAALSAQAQCVSPSLSIPALMLNASCTAVMSVVNYFQPSQLAEEQRSAARQFRKLVGDVEYALQVAPHLCQDTCALLRDSQHRLQALDAAFPMPLTPGGLEKFPSRVVPPALLSVQASSIDTSGSISPQWPSSLLAQYGLNGWDDQKPLHLQRLAEEVRRTDIDMYVQWSENVVKVNKCLAIGAPLLAAAAAAFNGSSLLGSGCAPWAGTIAAVCSLLAAFTGSVSHDLQLGTVFEMYRNAAGHYGEVEESIMKTLREPTEERENGELFVQRVAYKLGRWTEDLQ